MYGTLQHYMSPLFFRAERGKILWACGRSFRVRPPGADEVLAAVRRTADQLSGGSHTPENGASRCVKMWEANPNNHAPMRDYMADTRRRLKPVLARELARNVRKAMGKGQNRWISARRTQRQLGLRV